MAPIGRAHGKACRRGGGDTVFAVTDERHATRSGAFIGEEKEVEASADAHDAAQQARFWELAEKIVAG